MLTKLIEFFARSSASQNAPVYLVGGYIRDHQLSVSTTDVDLAVAGDSAPIASELANTLGGALVPLGPSHGVSRVVVREENGESWTIDLAGYPGSIEEDLGPAGLHRQRHGGAPGLLEFRRVAAATSGPLQRSGRPGG